MGILDDAIKEHLDLKRQHGADDSEVKRLEDEAFGPPTRPGEPDFPESQEQAVLASDSPAAGAPPDAGASRAENGAEDATALLDREAPPASGGPEPATDPGQTAAEVPAEAPPEAPPSEPPPSEPTRSEPPSPSEPPQPSEPEEDAGGFYDQDVQSRGLDVGDLDLDLADEDVGELLDKPETGEHEEPPSEELPAEEPPSEELPAEEPPVAGLETEEHPMEELLADEAAVGVPEAPPAPDTDEELLPEEPEPPATEEEPAEGGSPATDPEGEDVLEETPEFLRDQPEDDELWFEQGEPKDFDF